MASKTIVEMIDDLDGTADGTVTTVEFSVQGVIYNVDLNETNRLHLDDLLEPYVTAARRVGGRRRPAGQQGEGRSREEVRQIRRWAVDNGLDVSERGRLSAHILRAYEEAQAQEQTRSTRRRGKTKS